MLLTVEQLSEKYPAFTIRYLRTLLAERRTNGLDAAVLAVSKRRLMIDEEKFMEWLESKREGSQNE